MTYNFNLSSNEIAISFKGYGGTTIAQILSERLGYARTRPPDIVLLQTASYYLGDRDHSVDDIFRDLVDLVMQTIV